MPDSHRRLPCDMYATACMCVSMSAHMQRIRLIAINPNFLVSICLPELDFHKALYSFATCPQSIS